MPGLCGVVQAAATPPAAQVVDVMLARLCRYAWHVPDRLDMIGVSLGHAAVMPAGGEAPKGLLTSGHLAVGFDGELYDPAMPSGGRTVETVTERLLGDGPSFFNGTHGCFACAVWDEASLRLSLATDRYGMRPLYWTRVADRFLFASEVSALLAVAGVSRARDESGLSQFLSFGHFLGESTLYSAIRLVPAGSWLTFDAQAGTVTTSSYVTTSDEPTATSHEEWKALVDERATAAVAHTCVGGGRLGLSLSGGLDARTILGLAPSNTKLTCVSLGIPGSIDHRAAAALAARAGQAHHQLMLSGDFLGRFETLLREVVHLTDGHYLDQGIVLTTLPTYRELGIQTLLRGHAGELMHMSKAYAFSIDEAGLRLDSKQTLVDWLWRHLTGYMIGAVDERLFTGNFGGRMRDMARAALEQQASRYDAVEPVPQRIWRLFLSERLRRETAPSLQLFRNFVETRVPFLDPALVEPLLRAPVDLKVGDELQAYILRNHRPSFLDIVNANTGAPLSAGAWRSRAAYVRMKVLAKLGVAGYQPYERLGLWLARDLKPLVHRLLLSDAFFSRGIFEPAGIRALLEQHESRRRNHTYLIMALLIFEIAQGDRGE